MSMLVCLWNNKPKNTEKRKISLEKHEDFILLMDEPKVSEDLPKAEKPEKKKSNKKKSKKKIWLRVLLSVMTVLACVVVTAVLACQILLNGPSPTMRDALVLSAKQASATKWLPGLFLPEELVHQIEESSKTVTYDVISMESVTPPSQEETVDEWADAIDGIRFINITKPAFKAYLLMVKDPTRVFVGTSSDFQSGKTGSRIFDIVDEYGAVAAINGGEFPDTGGVGSGATPIGITFAGGKMVWAGPTNRSFVGFTADHRLVASEGMTQARAKELGIRDGVCFQSGNCLISNDGTNMTLHYSDGDTGRAQRTAIGQRADGTVLLLVTDGRTASSIGATHNELISLMLEYGAVVAGKLDGGSSAMMYYRDYYNLYNYDMSKLDEYQRRGLVNSYKAFTEPRRLPTYFLVGEAK